MLACVGWTGEKRSSTGKKKEEKNVFSFQGHQTPENVGQEERKTTKDPGVIVQLLWPFSPTHKREKSSWNGSNNNKSMKKNKMGHLTMIHQKKTTHKMHISPVVCFPTNGPSCAKKYITRGKHFETVLRHSHNTKKGERYWKTMLLSSHLFATFKRFPYSSLGWDTKSAVQREREWVSIT